jgi:hypothetical protein
MSDRNRRGPERLRERRSERQNEHHTPGAQPVNPGRERVDSIYQSARNMLSAARELIDETLSGESEEYLESVRQAGGQ